ncbi:MAG: hypothetical protein R3C15_20605 [Thermoleophilia bacterium]
MDEIALDAAVLGAMASLYPGGGIPVADAVALREPRAPASPMVNRVGGLGLREPATEAALDAVAEAMRGVRHYVAVSPRARPGSLGGWLADRGYTPGWGWMQFARGVDDVPAAGTDLDVVSLPSARSEAFGRVVVSTFGLPPALVDFVAEVPAHPAWHAFAALDGGRLVATGAVHVAPPYATLSFGATAETHRGRGGQGAILAARIRLARELGCSVVLTETGERVPDRPSQSYRNILRAGFAERYVVANWLSPEPA